MADPARINSRADLHAALRGLFEEFEGSYLDVATAADSGVATVHEMVSGRRFPRWTTLRKVLRAFGIAEADLSAWKQAHARADRDDDGCPYQGLEAFGPEHVKYFFGRRELTRLLWDRVSAQIERDGPLLVTGPSGAGKSSLLRAGLIPAADKSWPEGHVILTPGGDPVQVLADRFCGEAAPDDIRDRLVENPAVLHELLTQAPCRLLIVDQFEEIFTSCADADDRRVFIQALHAACIPTQGAPATVVVIGMRADFFGCCAAYPELAPALARPLVVGPMTTAQLREAIEKPAGLAQLTLEAGLAERILEDLGAASTDDTVFPAISSDPGGVLPLLSHTLRATWGRRDGCKLTLVGYQATGGVSQSLARTADTALDKVGLANRDRARRLLTRLVHLGEGSEPSRRRVPLAQLLGPENGPGHENARQVLDQFVEDRLVTVNWTVDGDRADSTAEFTHEALIRAWRQLRSWIEEDRDSLLVREQLDRDTRAWVDKGRDAAYLYRGLRLASAQEASGDDGDRLGNDTRDFLDASIRQDQTLRRRTRDRYIAVALVLALIASLTTFLVDQMRVGAERAAESQSRVLANFTLELADNDPGLAALAAIAAYKSAPTQEARSALLRRYDQFKNAAWALTGVQGPIKSAAMSADGTVTLAVSDLGRATLFIRQSDGKVLRTHLNVDGNATFPLVSRNGRRIAYTLDGKGAMVWHDLRPADRDIVGPAHRLPGAELQTFAVGGQWGDLSIVAFSPRADQIATVDLDGRLRLWSLTKRMLRTLPQHPPRLQQVWFGPNENTLVAELRSDTNPFLGTDRSVVSLDLRTGKVRELEDRRSILEQRLEEVAVSGDGRVLITCRTLETGKTVYRAVLVADGRQLARYTSDNAFCYSPAVDSAGERFAVFSGVSIWVLVNTRPDVQPQRFSGLNPSSRVLGPLLGDARDPIVVHKDENMVTGWRMFSDDTLLFFGVPMLLDHGRTVVARTGMGRYIGDRPDKLTVIETENQRRTLADVRIDATTPPDQYQLLAVNDSQTLVADVADHNRIVIRDLPQLREVAKVTARMPPAGKDGKRELVNYFFLNDQELVTASGGVLEHWNARDGRRLSDPLDVRDLRIDGMDLTAYDPRRHLEPGYVQIVNQGDHTLRAINLRTRKENTDLQIHLGGDTDTAFLSRRGDTALVKTKGGVVEFWSVRDRRRPVKVLGSLGLLQRQGWKVGVWGDSGFFLAIRNSVKFVNLIDPDRASIESYDFADNQTFVATADDGKGLLLTNTLYGGLVELFRLDPELWQRHLCDVLGRDMDNGDRQNLPPDLPDVICPPR